MRVAPSVLAVPLALAALSGCAFNAGAGVGGRLGERPGAPNVECDNFESCDAVYQDAVANAARCRDEGEDCDDEERTVNASYAQLREQTQLELDALRNELRDRDEAFDEAEPPPDEPPEGGLEGSGPNRPPEPPAAAPHGNGWFEPNQAVR